jgi:hypothetical protein
MVTRRRKSWPWLVVAALLLGLGAWLMRGAEPAEREPAREVTMPRRMTQQEQHKGEQRRTWVPQAAVEAHGPPQRPQDPVLALIPAELERGAVVAEFNAILNSELGGLMTRCLFAGSGGEAFLSGLKDAGMDPTTSIDRVAMIDDAVVMSGNFQNAALERLIPTELKRQDYGKKGQLLEAALPDGGATTFASWGGQLLIAGGDQASQKALLDRLDGSGPKGPSAIDDSMAYGEVYGLLKPTAFARAFAGSDPQLGELITQSVKSVQLHVDVTRDVGLVADVEPSDATSTDALRRALGSALSVARVKAQAEGKPDQAEVLDLARVLSPDKAGAFRLEAGLPYEFLRKAFEDCIAQAQRSQRPQAQETPDAG